MTTAIDFNTIESWSDDQVLQTELVLSRFIATSSNGDREQAALNLGVVSDVRRKRNLEPQPDIDFLISETLDDEGNAQCVSKLFPNSFNYCPELGWMRNTGIHWEVENAEQNVDRAIVTALKTRRHAGVEANREEVIKCAKPNANNVRNAKFLFKSIVATSIKEFDKGTDTLNCLNGVVNLKSGHIRPRNSGDKFTYCIDTEYDPNISTVKWESLVLELLGGSQAMLEYFQSAIGYSITGDTREECLFYVHGMTRSGKGTLSESILTVLGKPLSSTVDFTTFTQKRDADSQNFDLASLKATRFLVSSENNSYEKLNPRRIKTCTGGDFIYCAHKYGNPFQYRPVFKMWLFANPKLNADADDDALWGRVKVIELPNSYLGKEDKTLKHQTKSPDMQKEILAWAIRGAVKWYADGLVEPQEVKDATQSHRDSNDEVREFLDDKGYINSKEGLVIFQSLYYEYETWCHSNGVSPKAKRSFVNSMEGKGCSSDREYVDGKQHRVIKGITRQ